MNWQERNIADVAWVVLDTETTGLAPGLGHRVVEIAAVRLENGRRVAEFQQMVNPERPQDYHAARITGIQDAQLRQYPPFAEIAPQLEAFIGDAVLVAHNAPFDAEFVGLELSLSQPRPPQQPVLPNPWLCTLQLARRHFSFDRNNLEQVARRLGVPMRRAHRALNDAYVTAEIFKRMHRELTQRYRLETVGDWVELQGGPIFTPPPAEVPLLEPLASAVANRTPLRLLCLEPDGLESYDIIPRYTTFHKGEGQLTGFDLGRQHLCTWPIATIFSAELRQP